MMRTIEMMGFGSRRRMGRRFRAAPSGWRSNRRAGVSVVEMAVVSPLVLMVLLGMVDLGVAVYSYNTVAEAARAGARYAAVHGSRSSGPVGPAANHGNVEKVVREYAPGMSAAALTVQSSWPDGNNRPGSRVRVTAEYNYQLAVTWFLGFKSLKLSGTSTMFISH